MEPATADNIAKAIIEQMKASGHTLWIDPETHAAQHEFISELIQERKERKERRKRIEERVVGSVLLSAIVGLVTLLGAGSLGWLREHLLR